LKTIVVVYKDLESIEEFVTVSSNIGANIFLTKSLKDGIKFHEKAKEKADLFIIDKSFQFIDRKIRLIKENLEKGFKPSIIDNSIDGIEDLTVSKALIIEKIRNFEKIKTTPTAHFKKAPMIFREKIKFMDEIRGEVRRAKRYKYPLAVVIFKLEVLENSENLIVYFSRRVREFDYLWVISQSMFAMVLPHTAWNGAQILSNRLVRNFSTDYNIELCSLKNKILSYKRVESDENFINRIEQSITGEFHEINHDIDFYVWKDELFNEFIERQTIRIFNRYKGMLVSHDADMVFIDGRLNLYNIRSIQQNIIDIDKIVYFYSSAIDKTIRAGIDYLDKENHHALLSSFEAVDPIVTKTTFTKLLIEEKIDVFLNFNSDQIKAEMNELSLDEVTVTTTLPVHFELNQHTEISFSLPVRDKVYEISSNSKVLQSEEGSSISFITFSISTSLKDNMKISEFLSIKQISFIKELKS
jgi:hypothetical protein